MICMALPNLENMGETIFSGTFFLHRSAPSMVIQTWTPSIPFIWIVSAIKSAQIARLGSLPPWVMTMTYLPFFPVTYCSVLIQTG